MSYILVEESVFRNLMKWITSKQEENVRYDFTEVDYWMNGKDVCDYLQISQALLNTYRRNNTLCCCRIKEIYHYKRADVYKLKTQMDKELVDSGSVLLGECTIINSKEQAFIAFEENDLDIQKKEV